METKRFKTLLKKNGHFVTTPRIRLFTTLQQHDSLTIHELIGLLKGQDQGTVYRNIKLFESLGILNRLRLGWHSKLELSDIFQHHHHHFTCLKCGKVIALKENRTIEEQIKYLSEKLRFKATDHQLEIRGYCQNCLG